MGINGSYVMRTLPRDRSAHQAAFADLESLCELLVHPRGSAEGQPLASKRSLFKVDAPIHDHFVDGG
jgi:hypothetical protein